MEIAAAQLLNAFHESIAKSNAQNSQACSMAHALFRIILKSFLAFYMAQDCAIFITRCDVCEHTNSLCV
jgi:uncharacterized PurR-regulated membrane protein YhhQ (DUF165 family)